ncbi:MAG: DUF3422 domain-containing protein [Rhodospirillaceae bacterium]|nr:DUF3422 domain-containing protein [Rhodospirillaceae bacterium]
MDEQQTTLYPLVEHPLRAALSEEIRARPYEILNSPLRGTYLASLSGENGGPAERAHVVNLCSIFNVDPPHETDSYFSATFKTDEGEIRFRWERHTEFSTYFFHMQAKPDCTNPFENPVIRLLPIDWLTSIPGKIMVATHLALEKPKTPERSIDEISNFFGGNTIAGSFMSRGRAKVWTDFRFHADGFGRHLICDIDLDGRSAGRMIQRLLEINTYRMLSMLALPEARSARPAISDAEQRLSVIVQKFSAIGSIQVERELLRELSDIAARMENISAKISYRMASTRAYYELVKRRVEDIHEERIPGIQPPGEFVNRRLIPAMDTCFSVERRLDEISKRIIRATDLLRTRVDVTLEEQNRDLLSSMNRRAQMQIRLQQTVEGLSVVAISYYLTGLVVYAAKGAHAAGLMIDYDLAGGVAFPIILVAVWLSIRRVRRAIIKTDDMDT